MGASLPRARRRSYKKKNPYTRLLVIIPCAVLLIALAVFYVGRYQKMLAYRQYPLSYKALIVEKAEEFNLQPWHVAAVVRCESSFNPDATSNVGACGLMQIMPETGKWLAGKFGEGESYTDDALFDVDTNLKYGCWYLRFLKEKFSGDLRTVTAAYHAGQGQVQSWVNSALYSDDGLTVERIPFDSTATYVERVETAYEHYRDMYSWEETP